MARKRRRNQGDLRGVAQNSSEYWEEVLGRAGLTTARGHDPRLIYVGDSNVLDRIAGEREMGVVPEE